VAQTAGKLGGDVAVAVSEIGAADAQPQHRLKVRARPGEDKVLAGDDLGQRRGVATGQVEHSVVAVRVGDQVDQSGHVTCGAQHPGVAEQQVLRGALRPGRAAVAGALVAVGPVMQPVAIAGQPGFAEVAARGDVEFLVTEQIHQRTGGCSPLRGTVGEGAPGHGVQYVFDLDQSGPGQFVQVVAGQAATGCGQQTEQVLLDRVAGDQAFDFGLAEPLQVTGVRGVGERPDDVRVAQWVPVRHVVGHRRVGPAGHDDPHPGRRNTGQQRGDATRVRAGGDAPVLIQAVDDQHQPHPPLPAVVRGLVEQVQQPCLP
jgi:hypothetical protein